jgi:hypothetical protein
MVCAGATFVLHESANKVIDVSGLHDALAPIKKFKFVRTLP